MKRLGALSLFALLLSVSLSEAVTVRSAQGNFVVTAESQQLAQQVAAKAEWSRETLALLWVGHKLEPWSEPCPIKVTIADHSGGGATSFGFGGNGIPSMHMSVEGTADKILSCVVPHEVCHTIWATYLKKPTIRWADEGAAVTCEDGEECSRQDKICRKLLNEQKAIPLARLFAMNDYPSSVDQYGRRSMNNEGVMALYAQGYSVTSYLISLKGRQQFIYFVWHGQQRTWDEAVRASYGMEGVAELEKNWKAYLVKTKGATNREGPAAQAPATVDPTARAGMDATPPASSPNIPAGVGTAPAVRVGGGEVQLASSPPVSPTADRSSNSDRALSLLVEAQTLLARDVKELKSSDQRQNARLDRIEQQLGWNQQRASQQSQGQGQGQPQSSQAQPGKTSLPFGGIVEPYNPNVFPRERREQSAPPGGWAVPTAAPPSSTTFIQYPQRQPQPQPSFQPSFQPQPQYQMPFCPPGGT